MPSEHTYTTWKDKCKSHSKSTQCDKSYSSVTCIEGFSHTNGVEHQNLETQIDPALNRIRSLEASFNTLVTDYTTKYNEYVDFMTNVEVATLQSKNFKCQFKNPQTSDVNDQYFRINKHNYYRKYEDPYNIHASCDQEFITDASKCETVFKLMGAGVISMGKSIYLKEPCDIEGSIIRDEKNIKDMAYLRPDGALVMYPDKVALVSRITADSYSNECPANTKNPSPVDISSVLYANMTSRRIDNRQRNDLTNFTGCRIPSTESILLKTMKSLQKQIDDLSEKLLIEISNYMVNSDKTFENDISVTRANVVTKVKNVKNMKTDVEKEYKKLQKEASALEHIKDDLEVKYTNLVVWSSIVLLIAFLLIKYM